LTVSAVYRDGTTVDVTASTAFRSLDPSLATVDSHGAVHALAPGHARLQASYTDPATRLGTIGAVDLEVVGLPGDLVLDRLSVEPASAQIALVGEQRALQIVGHSHRDTDVFTRDVSCLASWVSAAPAIASLTGGVLHAAAVGTTTLTATVGTTSVSLSLQVLESARPLVTTFNFQPSGAPAVTGWAVADDSGFDLARGWGWVSVVGLWSRGDRTATPDPRLGSFIGAMAGSTFRLQLPDGRYHLAAAMGDNTFGGGVSRLDFGAQNLVAHVGNGNTADQALIEITGGMGLLLAVDGPINWLAVMPVNGLRFDAALASAKTW